MYIIKQYINIKIYKYKTIYNIYIYIYIIKHCILYKVSYSDPFPRTQLFLFSSKVLNTSQESCYYKNFDSSTFSSLFNSNCMPTNAGGCTLAGSETPQLNVFEFIEEICKPTTLIASDRSFDCSSDDSRKFNWLIFSSHKTH